MKNKLSDLNNYLFAQLERLDDESVTGDALDEAIKRGGAIVDTATQIIANANLQLKAVSTAHEMGMHVKAPALLMITDSVEE